MDKSTIVAADSLLPAREDPVFQHIVSPAEVMPARRADDFARGGERGTQRIVLVFAVEALDDTGRHAIDLRSGRQGRIARRHAEPTRHANLEIGRLRKSEQRNNGNAVSH